MRSQLISYLENYDLASAAEQPSPLYRCPKCGGTMVIIQTLTAAQILLRSPPALAGVAA